MRNFQTWVSEAHPDFCIEEGWMKNAALGATMMGAGLGIGSQFGSSNTSTSPTSPQQKQVVNQDSNFWQSGVYHSGDNIVSRQISQNKKMAEAKAKSELSKFLGKNQIPPGIQVSVEEKDGVFAATATWSNDSNQAANQAAQQMQQMQVR